MADDEVSGESAAIRLKRLQLRSARRGIREMDLVLGAFARTRLAQLSPADLDAWEALLDESDHDLLAWVTGAQAVPARHAALIAMLVAHAGEAAKVRMSGAS